MFLWKVLRYRRGCSSLEIVAYLTKPTTIFLGRDVKESIKATTLTSRRRVSLCFEICRLWSCRMPGFLDKADFFVWIIWLVPEFYNLCVEREIFLLLSRLSVVYCEWKTIFFHEWTRLIRLKNNLEPQKHFSPYSL